MPQSFNSIHLLKLKVPTLLWLWQHAQKERLLILLACLCGIVRVGIGLAFVWVGKLLVDTATSAASTDEQIVRQSIWLVTLLLVEMAFQLATSYLSSQTEIRMKNCIKADIYNHLLSCRWDKLSELHSGDLLNRITEDVRMVSSVVCGSLPLFIVMAIQLVAAFTMLYAMNWTLAVCVVCITPFFLLVSKIYVKRTRKLTAIIRKSDSEIQTNLQEGLQHHMVVQTFECEEQMSGRLASLQDQLYDQTMHRTRFGIFSRSMLRIGFIACYATAFLWSVWHLRSGAMTYGMMTAFLQLVARIQNPMINMAQLVPNMVHSLSSIDRLQELEDLPSEGKSDAVLFDSPAGIRLNGVTFRYDDKSKAVFDQFSHDFLPGSHTVVMGETGVGKSTLVRLLLALIHPQQGEIEIYNDKGFAKVSASTRCNMVYVPQGNSLLQGTIRENLLLGNPDATSEMMHEALHTACADFVFDLPDGLDTRCGELGHGLSEGQAQRIAIARALLRSGCILLLDEFNSSLDVPTARTLMNRLMKNTHSHTLILISHRPEVTSVENILRLSLGRVI